MHTSLENSMDSYNRFIEVEYYWMLISLETVRTIFLYKLRSQNLKLQAGDFIIITKYYVLE
jgi:hypothetical protein